MSGCSSIVVSVSTLVSSSEVLNIALDVISLKLLFYLLVVGNVAFYKKLPLFRSFFGCNLLLCAIKTILLAHSLHKLFRFSEGIQVFLLKDLKMNHCLVEAKLILLQV